MASDQLPSEEQPCANGLITPDAGLNYVSVTQREDAIPSSGKGDEEALSFHSLAEELEEESEARWQRVANPGGNVNGRDTDIRTQENDKDVPGEQSESPSTCVECEDQHAEMECLSCGEPFCRPCWGSLHRHGKRAEHVTRALIGELMPAPSTAPEPPPPPPGVSGNATTGAWHEVHQLEKISHLVEGESLEEGDYPADKKGMSYRICPPLCKRLREVAMGFNGRSMEEECKFIPLRLDERERRLLAMLHGALNASEYTDMVDVISRWGEKSKTVARELRCILRLLLCMLVAGDPKGGEKVLCGDNLEGNEEFFQEIFEVGRRYKITNPDKFRSQYGKMMYMLQDSQALRSSRVCLVKDIKMVHSFVSEREGLDLLRDNRVYHATAEFSAKNMRKEEVSQHISRKRSARMELIAQYSSDKFSKADVERALDSIADANNYLAFNVSPVERMLDLLKENFDPDKPEGQWSLRLVGRKSRNDSDVLFNFSPSTNPFNTSFGRGRFGSSFLGSGSSAKLSHDHRTQYTFVTQSLRLWSEAMRNMYRLWYFADSDLLNGRATYRLCNTGQGLNRVQTCPSVSMEMWRILNVVQSDCGPWVGLSVVHLGDRDVPNALMFIDKYTQIPRILGPIVNTVVSLDELVDDPVLGQYVDDEWERVYNLKMRILSDFFKHGFDGDGDDGGSCIDGRLTSSWNWCSKIEKKDYYPIFNLTGFSGFDGDWKD
ncbi:unnamed protein product [Choristocarpus tenellus]